jgi:hypothetical protein
MALRPDKNEEILDFDGGDDDGRGGQGPMLLSIALGLAMVVAILVTVWYFFADSRGSGASSGGVPVVQADPAAIKTKPTDPGGMDVPNKDISVYERLGKNETAMQPPGERLLPPPETPQAPPVQPKQPEPPKMSLATPKPEPLGNEPAKPAAAPPAPVVTAAVHEPAKVPEPAAKPEPVKPEVKKPEPVKAPEPVAKPEPPKKTETAKTLEPPKVAAAPPPAPAPAKPAEVKPAEPKPAEAKSAPLKLGKGEYQIQLAALHDIESAQKQWSRMAAANRDVLGSLSPDIVRADLGSKGVFFRLRAGPLDEASARRLCEELGKRKIGCMVVHK